MRSWRWACWGNNICHQRAVHGWTSQQSKEGHCSRREVVFYSRHGETGKRGLSVCLCFLQWSHVCQQMRHWELTLTALLLVCWREAGDWEESWEASIYRHRRICFPFVPFFSITARLTCIFCKSLSLHPSIYLCLSLFISSSFSLCSLFSELLFARREQNGSSAPFWELGRNWQTGFLLWQECWALENL